MQGKVIGTGARSLAGVGAAGGFLSTQCGRLQRGIGTLLKSYKRDLHGLVHQQHLHSGCGSRNAIARSFSSKDSNMVEFAFQNKDGSLTHVTAKKGRTLLEVAHDNQVDLEGACEQSIACR